MEHVLAAVAEYGGRVGLHLFCMHLSASEAGHIFALFDTAIVYFRQARAVGHEGFQRSLAFLTVVDAAPSTWQLHTTGPVAQGGIGFRILCGFLPSFLQFRRLQFASLSFQEQVRPRDHSLCEKCWTVGLHQKQPIRVLHSRFYDIGASHGIEIGLAMPL